MLVGLDLQHPPTTMLRQQPRFRAWSTTSASCCSHEDWKQVQEPALAYITLETMGHQL
jgi:hypothetical protein